MMYPVTSGEALRIAMICHEANRAYCQSIGDDTQLPWDQATKGQRESAIAGVRFHIGNPDADDAASHNQWMSHKFAAGWQFGEVKDEGAKTHPCLVPFEELPAEQQFKDKLFRTLVHAVYATRNIR